MAGILNKVFDPNKREIKRLQKWLIKLKPLLRKWKDFPMMS